MLQLGQALRGGKIQAEEYNSLLDGLYPLLEAAAGGSDRFGGSVAKLTAAVKDGKVSSKEFFDAIIAGSDALEGKAAKANLTLSSSLTTLTNALTVYVGESDKSSGASVVMGAAIGKLAENIDILIPALATIAVMFGSKYVAAAAAATFSTTAKAAADVRATASANALAVAMQMRLNPAFASTSASAVAATASITRFGTTASLIAGRGLSNLVTMLGGPAGMAIAAFTIGLTSIAAESRRTSAALDNLEREAEKAANKLDTAEDGANRAAEGVKGVGSDPTGQNDEDGMNTGNGVFYLHGSVYPGAGCPIADPAFGDDDIAVLGMVA